MRKIKRSIAVELRLARLQFTYMLELMRGELVLAVITLRCIIRIKEKKWKIWN